MDLAYAAADLAICRSGAMTVPRCRRSGLPAVYVPLPIGNGEQRLNALPVVDAGGGLLVADADLTPGFVADVVGTAHGSAPAGRDDHGGRLRRASRRGASGWPRSALDGGAREARKSR